MAAAQRGALRHEDAGHILEAAHLAEHGDGRAKVDLIAWPAAMLAGEHALLDEITLESAEGDDPGGEQPLGRGGGVEAPSATHTTPVLTRQALENLEMLSDRAVR